MKVFNNLEEMKPYYNEETNTYEFVENEKLLDVELNFDLNVDSNIHAGNIKAYNINAGNINSGNINSGDINSGDINSGDINAWDINAGNIKAYNINAGDINAGDINAWDINAGNINSGDINFYAVCFAYKTFVCKSVKGTWKNNKYFCLDSEIVIKGDKKNVK